ncbi:hypothetical protein U9M48_011404 [Paspalum notatum var. saurae]|uniref:NB-ARC domain-containing protein n=1 Tax=Paspalum notatum var. saurae TaxID=547442 RepID=A0AAQ3SWZ4_PASNO
MEAIISAIIGELATRSFSFLTDRYLLKPAPISKESLNQLQWMLLRVRLTIEEAEGRCITNQAMLHQLNILRRVMNRGYYMLHSLILHIPKEEEWRGKRGEHGVSRFLSLSISRPAVKRVCFGTGNKYGTENLEKMLKSLEIAIAGMSEFLIFLRNCPPMSRQPYSTYLSIEKCMFGRQMELQRVINFLLHEEPPVHCDFGVLPIVGPGKVGKSTLVEHVRCDERGEGSRIKHQHGGSSSEEKILVIIELVGDIDEGAWRWLHSSASQSRIPRGSKVIITSRSENIVDFGTTHAINLEFLSREAYWYFFQALVFGSSAPEEQPRFASIAMEIFDEYFDQELYKLFAGPFIYLKKTAMDLKSSFNVQSWNRILACFKDNRRQNEPGFREGLISGCRVNNDDVLLQRVVNSAQYCVVHNHDRVALVNKEAPKLTLHDILDGAGSIRLPHSKFDILVWESHLPPYHKYIYSCQILEFDCKVAGNKQGQKRKSSSY